MIKPEKSPKNPKNLSPSFAQRMGEVWLYRTGGVDFSKFPMTGG